MGEVDVTPVAIRALVPDALPQVRTLPQPSPEILPDSTSMQLPELADPEIRRVLHTIEQARAPEDPLSVVQAAAAQHNIPEALRILHAEFVAHPDNAAAIVSDPSLHAIRDNVRALLERLTGEAKVGAQKVLETALPFAPAAPQIYSLANRFFETGQYINYVRAQELGRVVIAAGATAAAAKKTKPIQVHLRIQKVWSRAPLLILFGVWMLTGLIGWAGSRGAAGVAFDIWALGFLALVGIQFCITIRNFQVRGRGLIVRRLVDAVDDNNLNRKIH